jgi:hypothetical protein
MNSSISSSSNSSNTNSRKIPDGCPLACANATSSSMVDLAAVAASGTVFRFFIVIFGKDGPTAGALFCSLLVGFASAVAISTSAASWSFGIDSSLPTM